MNNKEEYRKWIEQKIAETKHISLKETSVSSKFTKQLGGRGMFAEVTISARNSDEFSFISSADWTRFENYDKAVLDGILTALFAQRSEPFFGSAFTLESVVWHPVDSCYLAFFQAAKKATQEILRLNGYWE